MNNDPNLHPIWAKQFGIESKAKPHITTPATVVEALTGPVATQTSTRTTAAREETLSRAQIEAIFDDSGWMPTSPDRPAYGAAVTVKKQLSRHTWITTLALPGDARYPAAFRTPTTQGETK